MQNLFRWAALMGFAVCGSLIYLGKAETALKKQARTEDDLPRFAYPVEEGVPQLLRSDAGTFLKFAASVRADVEKTLRDYEIKDHATLRKLLGVRLDAQILTGSEDEAALRTIKEIRSLEDKPDAKLLTRLREEAFLKARSSHSSSPGACPAEYEAAYRSETQALPWPVVGTTLRREKSFLELFSKNFLIGVADQKLQPMAAKTHSLTLAGAEEVMDLRVATEVAVNCKEQSLAVLSGYIAGHSVRKPSIWEAREAVLPPSDKLTPVNVGIWDSGFDTSLFADRLFTDSTPGINDPHGTAFDVMDHHTQGDLIPLTAEQKADYPNVVRDMEAAGDLQNGVDSPAASALKQKLAAMSPEQVRRFFEEYNTLSAYAHGTHVAGIAARGNPAIRLAYARITYDTRNPRLPPTETLLADTARMYAESVQWFRAHKIRVVNMSWWDRPSNFEKELADNGIGKDAAERKQLARHYFEIERTALYGAIQGAPEILFVTIAGNNNADNAFEECIPSSFRLPNLIVTGAVDQAGDEVNFTSYGGNVLVHADGLAVESVVPGGAKIKDSGTSMAAPQVTNLAAKLLAVDPALSPTQLIELIREGSDVSEDGRRHLINPRKSLELVEQGFKGRRTY